MRVRPKNRRRTLLRLVIAPVLAGSILLSLHQWPGTTRLKDLDAGSVPLSLLSTLAATTDDAIDGGGTGPACAVQSPVTAPRLDQPAALSGALGGDVAPVRSVLDPYPVFNGVAVDPENNIVLLSDTNRKSLLIYDRTAESKGDEITEPRRHIIGPATLLGFVSGVAVDPGRREVYAVNNDVEDNMSVFSYDANGNLKPKRVLAYPHGAWGLSLSLSRDELAMTLHDTAINAVLVYRREAKGVEAPLRNIRGANTGLADPHGIYLDDQNNEMVVANWGSWSLLTRSVYSSWRSSNYIPGAENITGGRFELPSITFYPVTAQGDAKPLRTIRGPKTRLNWPTGIDIDTTNDEIAVANNGDNSVLVFRRTEAGDVKPVRTISGERTGIDRPMSVAIDRKNNELWVANFGDHTALVFDRTATGNVGPKRIVRNAPAGTPCAGFGNPLTVAYDSKRDEILVPN